MKLSDNICKTCGKTGKCYYHGKFQGVMDNFVSICPDGHRKYSARSDQKCSFCGMTKAAHQPAPKESEVTVA